MYIHFFKRLIDLVLSFLALVVLSPFFAVMAILIKIDSPGPVIFRQKRVGRDKSFFQIYKFRTMYADTPKDVPTHLLADPNARITKTGAFLRRTSLDELPQVLNIFLGQMSIIGPRPALWNQDDLVAERDKYDVGALRPGLTGWAQINGRDELPIEVKSKLDGYYAENLSFALDVKIFFLTIARVFKGSGVAEGWNARPEKGEPAAENNPPEEPPQEAPLQEEE